jgi:hypothetical protein
MERSDHLVEFFATDDAFMQRIAALSARALAAGGTCIVIVTAEHRAGIDAALIARGLEPACLRAANRFVVLDAREILDQLQVRGGFDELKFHRTFGELLRLAGAAGRAVHILGETASLLARAGQLSAVIRFEELWNDLSREHPFVRRCFYPSICFTRPWMRRVVTAFAHCTARQWKHLDPRVIGTRLVAIVRACLSKDPTPSIAVLPHRSGSRASCSNSNWLACTAKSRIQLSVCTARSR